MSYILDALKKSERQRPPGPVPDLFTVQGPLPPAPRRPRAAVLLGSATLAAIAVLAVWAWSGRPQKRGVQQPVAVEAPAEAPSTGPPPAAVSVVATEPAPVVVSPEPRRVKPAPQRRPSPPAPGPAASVPPPPDVRAAVPAPAAGGAPTTPAAPVQAPAPSGPAPDVAERAPVPAAAPAASSAPEVPAPPPAPLAVPAVAATAPAAAPAAEVVAPPAAPLPPADGKVVTIDELPDSVRALAGKVTVSGHVWSEDAELRLLTVQDRLVREGGEVAPGVRLEKITRTGAVFSAAGWRFSLGGF